MIRWLREWLTARSRPLQDRLALLIAAAVAGAVAITGGAAYVITLLSVYAQLDNELVDVAAVTSTWLQQDLESLGGVDPNALHAANVTVELLRADNDTITLPAGGGGGGATVVWVTLTTAAQAITLPAATEGAQRIVVLTQDGTGGRTATWPEEVIWEGGAIPSVPSGPSERAVFTLLGAASGVWLGFLSGMFAAPVVPDTTAPTSGTLTASLITSSSFRLTATGSGDNVALHTQPYRFSVDNGVSYGAWQVSPDADFTGRTASTAYTCLHQVRDAAGNTSTGSPITATTLAASVPAITDSFNRADSTSGLGQTDTGQTWEQIGTGIVGIIGGAAYRASSNAAAVVDFGQADMWVTHKVVVPGDYFAGHLARYVDANNNYSLETSSAGGTGNVKVTRTAGGTQKAVDGAVIPSIAPGDTIGVSYKEVAGGTEIKMYKNGTLTMTATDNTAGRPMGTKAGIKPYNNVNIRLDDFSIQAPE